MRTVVETYQCNWQCEPWDLLFPNINQPILITLDQQTSRVTSICPNSFEWWSPIGLFWFQVYQNRMHTVQTYVLMTHLKMQKIMPILCRKNTKLYKLQRLLWMCLLTPTTFSTVQKNENKINYFRSSICFEICLTCEQFPLSNDQQHCSWFNQNAVGQMPNFKSVIQLAPISITPATQPDAKPTSNTHSQPDHASCAP